MYAAHRKFLPSVIGLIALASLVIACEPAMSTRAPEPTLQVLRVAVDPALDWLTPGLNACASQAPGLGIIRQDSTAEDADLALQYGPLESSTDTTVQLGKDELVVATNAKNGLANLPLEDLQSIYRGQAIAWSEFDLAHCAECSNKKDNITVWTYPPDDPLQQQVGNAFNLGAITPTAQVAASPAVMIKAISVDPFSIGIVPRRWLNDTVHALPITATGLQDKVVLPILAISAQPVDGMTRDWLLCLQDLFTPGQ